jgi:excisionase family DNA binding protein
MIEMEEFLSPKEVCKLLKVSETWPYEVARRRRVTHYKLGALVRFKKSDIEAWVEESRVEATYIKVPRKKEKPQPSEVKRAPEICRGCFKRTDGKVDYLIDGFCETCRPRPDLWNGRRIREPYV